MAIVTFDFSTDVWNMGPACGNPSYNPAPFTNPCIYIIHNSTENSTYVGYADDANDRWKSRTEVFHIMGIPKNYGKTVLCACCIPTVSGGKSMFLKGQDACEHLMIRAVVNGLLGITTSTNSQLGSTPFSNPVARTIRVYLPTQPYWGHLMSDREITFGNKAF